MDNQTVNNNRPKDIVGAPLLLLGSGRSGTTLLQRILNSYDEVIVWGEHGGILAEVADSFFKLTESESMKKFSYNQAKGNQIPLSTYKNPEQWQAWNNWFRPNDVTEIYKKFLSDMFLSDWEGQVKYWGFKEIRYGATDAVVDMFFSVFPDSKLLVVYRNPLNVIDSQLTAFHGVGGRLKKLRKIQSLPEIIRMAKRWRSLNLKLLEYREKYPGKVQIIQYEKFVSDEHTLATVLEDLGLEFGDNQRRVLNMKAGRGSAYGESKTDMAHERWKQLGLLPAIAVFLITKKTYNRIKKL